MITELSNVIDAQSSRGCEIALCSSSGDIISYWCRIYHLPQDLKHILAEFARSNKVYSSANRVAGGRQNCGGIITKWCEIPLFALRNINIIKIALGFNRSFFVDDTGIVWVSGNRYLGVKDVSQADEPIEIKYFVEGISLSLHKHHVPNVIWAIF